MTNVFYVPIKNSEKLEINGLPVSGEAFLFFLTAVALSAAEGLLRLAAIFVFCFWSVTTQGRLLIFWREDVDSMLSFWQGVVTGGRLRLLEVTADGWMPLLLTADSCVGLPAEAR
jgi:hypothetical protein